MVVELSLHFKVLFELRDNKLKIHHMKSIKPGKKYSNSQLALAILMLVLGVLGVFLGTFYVFLGSGTVVLFVVLSQKNKEIIKIFEDHLEVSFAPLAPVRYIKFSNITQIQVKSPKRIFIHYTDRGTSKKLRLLTHMMEKTDLDNLLELINKKIEHS